MSEFIDLLNENQGALSLVLSTVVAGAAVVLALITAYYARVTHYILKSQIEPVVDFELTFGEKGDAIAIGNGGAYQVLDVSVNADAVTFVGPPVNKLGARLTSGRRIPGRKPQDWWYLDKLRVEEVQTRPIADLAENALRMSDMMESTRERGEISGLSPSDKPQIFTFLVLRLTFHRDFDHKRYTLQKTAYVARETGTGKPMAHDAEVVRVPFFQEMLQKLRQAP